MPEQLRALLLAEGCTDVGFARVDDGPEGLPFTVSAVLALSDAVLNELNGAPTHTYFHHYRTVNAYLDRLMLRAGLLLQSAGFRYLPVAASQTIYTGGDRTHEGRYTHKKAAVLAGLGTIGKSTLFLHPVYGPRVRLATLFTDCPLPVSGNLPEDACGTCMRCVEACPAKAIKGFPWQVDSPRAVLFDAEACNSYMRSHFMQIGRGAVCGICVAVCPKRQGKYP